MAVFLPGKVTRKVKGWQFTYIHPTLGERVYTYVFKRAGQAKEAMREHVAMRNRLEEMQIERKSL